MGINIECESDYTVLGNGDELLEVAHGNVQQDHILAFMGFFNLHFLFQLAELCLFISILMCIVNFSLNVTSFSSYNVSFNY